MTLLTRGIPRTTLNRESREGKEDPVGGIVQGKKATAPEMMWARALSRTGHDFIFQFEVTNSYLLPIYKNSIDFVVDGIYADEIDGEIAHKTASQQGDDTVRDIQLNNILHQFGFWPIRRIDAMKFRDKRAVEEMMREYYA
jgi:hypothetical protein